MKDFWEKRWKEGETGWDAGSISTPLKTYFDQLTDKALRILIPGCGNAYEAEYLLENGFTNVSIIDISPSAIDSFKSRCPNFSENKIFCADFFEHQGKYDLIVEQTFFCAINPELRNRYVKKLAGLLNENGKYVGLLFDFPLEDGPPYGGSKKEYEDRFSKHFRIVVLEACYNSIKPREGRELFVIAERL